jgi:hypothetical protein
MVIGAAGGSLHPGLASNSSRVCSTSQSVSKTCLSDNNGAEYIGPTNRGDVPVATLSQASIKTTSLPGRDKTWAFWRDAEPPAVYPGRSLMYHRRPKTSPLFTCGIFNPRLPFAQVTFNSDRQADVCHRRRFVPDPIKNHPAQRNRRRVFIHEKQSQIDLPDTVMRHPDQRIVHHQSGASAGSTTGLQPG